MSFENEFLELMPDTVYLTPPTARNAQGQPTYVGGIRKGYRARIVGAIQALRTQQRSEESQSFVVYVASSNDPITTDYKLELPSDPMWEGQLGTTVVIYAVERFGDDQGAHHTKLVCGYGFHHQSQL